MSLSIVDSTWNRSNRNVSDFRKSRLDIPKEIDSNSISSHCVDNIKVSRKFEYASGLT